MKDELMTLTSVAELANKDLKKNCNAILKELTKVNKSAWSIAHFYNSIVINEQWKDDFESFKDFAEYVNVNRSTLILYSKVARISDILNDTETLKDIETVVTVSKMIEILPIFKDKNINDNELVLTSFVGVVNEMGGFDVFADMTNKEVREWIKFWVSEHEEAEETEEAETDNLSEAIIEDYVLTADNLKDFENTILNLIKQGNDKFHVSVRL